VGIEGENDQRRILSDRELLQLVDDDLVPKMNSIKIANRQRTATQLVRKVSKFADEFHGGRFSVFGVR
jgi:hypothetical protein